MAILKPSQSAKTNIGNHGFAQYAFALLAVAAGFLVRAGLTLVAGGSLPTYITFYPAVMLAALLGGLGPGLIATAAAALGVTYFILPSAGTFALASVADAVGLAFFTGMGVFMSVVAELYRRARQRAASHDTEIFLREHGESPARWFKQGWLINAAMVLSLAILVATRWLPAAYLRGEADADKWVAHSRLVIQHLDRLLSALKDEETGQRGYLLTGETPYLEPYQAALGLVRSNMAGLKELTLDNPAQQQRLAAIEALVLDKEGKLKRTIDLRGSQGLPSALEVMRTGEGKALMDQIRQQVAEAQGNEERLLAEGAAAKSARADKAIQSLLAGGVLVFLLLATIFFFLKQENTRRAKAEAEVRHHRNHLQEMVDARTRELGLSNDRLKSEIHEHEQAKEALRQGREWLRVTLTSIGDAVLATDTSGRITFLNPIAASLTGWAEKEALGKPAQSILHLINEQTRASAEDIVARVLREGQTIALANHTALIARDGREVPIEDSAAPIRDAAGNLAGAVLVFHDVTQRRRAQEALRESEQRLSTLGDNLPGGAIYQHLQQSDGRVRYVYMSAGIQKLVGMTAEKVMADAEAFRQLIIEEDRPRCAAAEEKSAREMSPFDCEFRERTVAGDIKWVHCLSTPRRLENGVILWDGVVTDITERKRAETALRASNEELNRFNKVAVGRELRMIELKKQVNELCAKLGQAPCYPLDFDK